MRKGELFIRSSPFYLQEFSALILPMHGAQRRTDDVRAVHDGAAAVVWIKRRISIVRVREMSGIPDDDILVDQ